MLLASEAAHSNVLLDNMIFFIIGLAVFALLGLFTWTFRDVANRHRFKAEAYAQSHPHEGPLNEFGASRH